MNETDKEVLNENIVHNPSTDKGACAHNKIGNNSIESSNETSETQIGDNRQQVALTSDDVIKILIEDRKHLAQEALLTGIDALTSLKEQQKKYSHRRNQLYYDPFVLDAEGVRNLDKVVVAAIERIKAQDTIIFSGLISCKNNRIINFNSIDSIVNWSEPEKSSPQRVQLQWQYSSIPTTSQILIPVDHFIYIDYSIEPNIRNKMILDVEEEIELQMEGPDLDWVRALNETLEVTIQNQRMPVWWRYLRKGLTTFKPYFDNGVYIALIFIVGFIWDFIKGKRIRETALSAILNATKVEEKIDLLVKFFLAGNSSVGFLLFIFFGMMIVGALHLFISTSYRHLAPHSVIALGIHGRRQQKIVQVYAWIWGAVITSILGAIIAKFV